MPHRNGRKAVVTLTIIQSDPFEVVDDGAGLRADGLDAHALRQGVGEAFVDLVGTLAGGFDVIDVLTGLTTRCVDLLGAAAAAILLSDGKGGFSVIGASNEDVRILESLQLQNEQGPGLDCYSTGEVVANSDLEAGSTWERFAKQSVAAGFPSVCAIPLRLRHEVLGCLSLFMSAPVPLSESDVVLARALADVASIALVQDVANREAAIREAQLQNAFRSRTVIEQAKGMIAQHCQTDLQQAFEGLRKYARNNNRRLTDVAESVVAGTIATWAFASKRRPPPPPSANGHR